MVKKFCDFLRKHIKYIIGFEKKKNAAINKKRTKLISRCKSMLYLWKKNLKSLRKIKVIEKSEIIVIIQVNREAQHLVFVI